MGGQARVCWNCWGRIEEEVDVVNTVQVRAKITYRPSVKRKIPPRVRPPIKAFRTPIFRILTPEVRITMEQRKTPHDVGALLTIVNQNQSSHISYSTLHTFCTNIGRSPFGPPPLGNVVSTDAVMNPSATLGLSRSVSFMHHCRYWQLFSCSKLM